MAERNLVSQREGNYVNIYVWTIDEPDHMKWLISAGVDGIITNNPKALAEQVVRKKKSLVWSLILFFNFVTFSCEKNIVEKRKSCFDNLIALVFVIFLLGENH